MHIKSFFSSSAVLASLILVASCSQPGDDEAPLEVDFAAHAVTLAADTPSDNLPTGYVTFAAVVGSIVAMLGGLWLVFARLKAKGKGFGPNSLKAL